MPVAVTALALRVAALIAAAGVLPGETVTFDLGGGTGKTITGDDTILSPAWATIYGGSVDSSLNCM